jgi:hypothetical protein
MTEARHLCYALRDPQRLSALLSKIRVHLCESVSRFNISAHRFSQMNTDHSLHKLYSPSARSLFSLWPSVSSVVKIFSPQQSLPVKLSNIFYHRAHREPQRDSCVIKNSAWKTKQISRNLDPLCISINRSSILVHQLRGIFNCPPKELS